MTYYNSARSKNFIIFTDDDNKTYTLDVNTGIFTNNQTNKPIKRFPVGFGRYLDGYNGGDAVISMMRHIRNNPRHYNITIDGYVLTTLTGFITAAKYLNFADRVQNVGGVFADYHDFESETINGIEENFKEFARYCRDNEGAVSPYVFLRSRGKEMFAAKYQLEEKYHLSQEEIDYLYDHYTREKDCALWVKYLPRTCYYMMRGIYELFGYNTTNKLEDFYNLCQTLGVEPPKDDFCRCYVNFKREYRMRKKELDLAALTRNYAEKRDALTFENEDFMVVIPQTPEDFRREADAQQNCVFSMYLDKVIAGKTHVVFVRRKDAPNASLVTCEVNNGRIWQYLARYNQRPSDPALLAFREAYQTHLDATWQR